MKTVHVSITLLALIASGCAHQVTFDKPEPYSISAQRHEADIIAVIDQQTLTRKVPVQAVMVGAAHTCVVEPGDMLKQIADIELPQMFARYEFSNVYKEATNATKGITLELAVPKYNFEGFRAKVMVRATAYAAGKQQVLQKDYYAEGEGQGGLMFVGGPFGMKSAIRQSSMDAYKKIFMQLRADVLQALQPR